MIRHQHLRPIGNQQVWSGNTPIGNFLNLLEQVRNVEGYSISQNTGGMIVKDPGRQHMKRELPVIVYNRVTGVASALKADNNIRLLRKHVRDFSFSFVAPVGADYCFYHLIFSPFIR